MLENRIFGGDRKLDFTGDDILTRLSNISQRYIGIESEIKHLQDCQQLIKELKPLLYKKQSHAGNTLAIINEVSSRRYRSLKS